ncbi:MAG TPA: DUF4190 domain-containing protein [Candidatus Sulfotelmatobacter sp.]|jgi:hypothetical protein|nr:DUF4190 domain-containing protein [Candidatus Sulfotelmatobacter sp.]
MSESRYILVGSDGKKYGPVSAAKLREWLQEGRVDSRTAVFIEGATEWTFLGLLPEFALELAGSPPVIGALKPQPVAGTNAFATWGLICGLLSWTFCGCCVPFAILGLTFSIIALVQTNSATQDGRGFAIAGVVLSATNLLWTLGLTLVSVLSNTTQTQWNLVN